MGETIVLLPCPFCGGEAEFERLGDRRQSCIVACTDCGARRESSDEGPHSGSAWNERAALTPPGHVLVGPDARETVARAITRSSPTKLVIGGASIDCVDAEAADEMASRIVDGFLSALGVRGGA